MDIKKDDYIFIDITWKSGFKHTVPCRGFNLKSQLEFTKSIFWIDKFTWRVVTEKDYNAKLWAPLEEKDNEPRASKGKALKEAAAKRKPRAKASEDSERVSASKRPTKPTAKRTTSTSKKESDELRKPKLPNVRKPKKDVQGTNNPRTKAAPRTRNTKSKTQ